MSRQARREVLDPSEVYVIHCITRCVRHAFFCGDDPLTRNPYEHRRGWIRERLELLASVFAIDCLIGRVVSWAAIRSAAFQIICNRSCSGLVWTRTVGVMWCVSLDASSSVRRARPRASAGEACRRAQLAVCSREPAGPLVGLAARQTCCFAGCFSVTAALSATARRFVMKSREPMNRFRRWWAQFFSQTATGAAQTLPEMWATPGMSS